MKLRTIRYEHVTNEQIQALNIGFQRWDELMQAVEETLCSHPEMFPVLKGTRISLCKTNEFFGSSFPDVPSLAIYFHYDNENVFFVSVEANDLESYGIE